VYLQTKSANISNFNRKSLNRNVNKYKEQEKQEVRKKNVFCYDGFWRTREQYFYFYIFADCRRLRRIRLVGWRWRVQAIAFFAARSEESSRHIMLCRIII